MRPFLIQTTFVSIAYIGLSTLAALERQPFHALLYLALAVFHHDRGRS